MKRFVLISMIFACVSCGTSWTEEEKALISGESPLMRVLTIENDDDMSVLRSTSVELSRADLQSETYRQLAVKMINTVTDPSQDGVGIAGPQVGVLRRVVAVQRFDKQENPFEVYPNIRITELRGESVPGQEGCLSVPDRYEKVFRSQDISISYTSPYSLRDTVETVEGFTAVIFQHEVDHLEGVLYIDRIEK